MLGRFFLMLAFVGILTTQAMSHEAWLQPYDFTLEKSPLLRGHIQVGQMLKGSAQLYNPDKFIRLESVQHGEVSPVKGRLGDLPAINHRLQKPGLHVMLYQSKGSVIHYDTWEKFTRFAIKEGVPWAPQAHMERGLPNQDFSETFFRYAKALVYWKHTEGKDARTAMPMEIVALDNPYAADKDQIRVEVLWQGKPYSNAQLTVFSKKADQATERSVVTLDQNGMATVDIAPGKRYLLNSVYLEPIEAKKNSPVWRSHWASMTFELDD